MSSPTRVCSFESRRNAEMRSLIERRGGIATVVPSMQEVPLDDNAIAIDFADQLDAGAIDFVVFMTGVGAQTLADAVASRSRLEPFLAQLKQRTIIARGPKPVAVLRKWGINDFHIVRQPNTWRELVELLDTDTFELNGRTIAVQEYGIPNQQLYNDLTARGATVFPVPVYRWKLPDDTVPLAGAIESAIAGEFDILLFTSANQARNVLTVADQNGLRTPFLQAATHCHIASIGPTCTETLIEEGFEVAFEADPPKMGQLVRGAMESYVAAMARRGQG